MVSNHYNRKILNSTAIVALCSLLAKGISALKDLIVAASFGTGESVDAFLLGALIPLLSVSVLAAPYGSALVPMVTRFIVEGNQGRAFRSLEYYLLRLLVPLIGVSFFTALFSGQIAAALVPEAGSLMNGTASALRVMAPLVVIAGLTQILVMALGAFEIFALPAISQVFSPLAIVAALYLLPENFQGNALAIGAVIGNSVQLLFLALLYVRRRLTCSVLPSGTEMLPAANLFSQWIPLFFSALLMSSTDIVDQVMAAYLGVGEVSTLSFGSRIPALLVSVLAGSLTSAAFPYLSQMIERGERNLLHQTLVTYTRLILLVSGVAVALIALFSLPIVTILFERGAFTSQDSARVAFVQQMAILQIPFYLLNGLYMRVIMALRAGMYLSAITLVSVLLNILLNLLFSRWIGVAGIALSTSCVYLWSTVALGYLMLRFKNSRES